MVSLSFLTLGFSKKPQLVPPVSRRGQRAWRPYRPGLEMAHHFSLPLVSTWSHGHSSYKGVWEMCSGLESRKKGEQDFGGQPTVSALVDNNAFNQNGKTRSQSSVRLSHIQDPSEFPRRPQRDSFLL